MFPSLSNKTRHTVTSDSKDGVRGYSGRELQGAASALYLQRRGPTLVADGRGQAAGRAARGAPRRTAGALRQQLQVPAPKSRAPKCTAPRKENRCRARKVESAGETKQKCTRREPTPS